jgi:ABC-type microcin C transport system permease subunit YejB
MMDCGRKFIPMSYLRSLVKMMSYYKMNTLQIHLNDNGFRQFFGNDLAKTPAAFRLECDTYPGLTAKAKGVHQYKIIFVHALRNALIPVITYVGPMIGGILTGSMVIESIFNIGGLGSKFVSCITNRDYTMIMATTLFLAVIMVGANLITDIVYKVIDPRIKLD